MAEAAYTERDVNRMEDLITAGNWVDLRIFLLGNPRVLNGADPFTQQLRKFLDETDSLYTALTFDPSLFPNVGVAKPTAPPPRVVRRTPRPANNTPSGDDGTIVTQSNQRPAPQAAPRVGAALSIY